MLVTCGWGVGTGSSVSSAPPRAGTWLCAGGALFDLLCFPRAVLYRFIFLLSFLQPDFLVDERCLDTSPEIVFRWCQWRDGDGVCPGKSSALSFSWLAVLDLFPCGLAMKESGMHGNMKCLPYPFNALNAGKLHTWTYG